MAAQQETERGLMMIRNSWYMAALSSEIKAELFARTILNEKVVMYRTSGGKLTALEDRCPHRQVPLSKGRLQDDTIECWYHGMQFDASGKCIHIPSQKVIPERACVRTYPAAEKYGFVWLWMGDAERCDEALIPDHSVCSSAQYAGEMCYTHAHTDYRLAIDNLLDLSHIAYVHPETISSLAVAETSPEITVSDSEVRVRRVLRKEKNSPLLKQMMKLDIIDRVQEVIYWPIGNTRVETIAHAPDEPDGLALRLFTTSIFTPETVNSCHIWVGIHRDFALDNQALTQLILDQVKKTVLEDKDVTEHLQANWKTDAPIIHLAVDHAGHAARRMLTRLQQQEPEVRERGIVELM
ncbi:Rieske 2Fe-2S domain-containing protein [Paraherbaspirillum soli]|uniref:Rieske 2Fe-2S domain-containing protein n=1 Tax=Paraherbaspirillum soli TaxID=631222 RepID=A0ABW0M7D1_9BURK